MERDASTRPLKHDAAGHAITHCRSENCGAEIIWTITEHGKRAPVDAEPRADGNIRLDHGRPVHSFVVTNELFPVEGDDGLRYVNHFATCPDAEHWRHGQAPQDPTTPGPEVHRTMHRSF